MATSVAEIITKVIVKQSTAEMTDVALAKKLGISRQLWGKVKTGKRNPGIKTLTAISREYPDLILDVMNYMAKKNGNQQ